MTPKPIRFNLTRDEMSIADAVARRRAAAGPVTEGEGVRRGSYTPYEIELTGMKSEIAVCRFYGQQPDLRIYKERRDAGADIHYLGKTANIKGTKYFSEPDLIIRDYDTRYDAYILCSVELDGDRVVIQGFATRAEVRLKPKAPYTEGAILSRTVPWEELHSCVSPLVSRVER